MKDRVYAQEQPYLVDFAFDDKVASVFPDMIRRSVPGYEVVVPLTGLMAARHLKNGDHAYDLGCSLGATSLALLSQSSEPDIRVTAVDNSAAMLDRAAAHLNDPRVDLIEADVRSLAFEPAQVVLSNWLLQFVPEAERLDLLVKIHQCLTPGGCLILSEKTHTIDAAIEEFFVDTHHAFKQANGYSAMEVAQKRSALENVMVPDSEETHIARLQKAGFERTVVWYRCLNWMSLVAYA